jgi:hypothetical protein
MTHTVLVSRAWMNSVLVHLSTILCLQPYVINSHETVRQLFYPGQSKSFDFFHLTPGQYQNAFFRFLLKNRRKMIVINLLCKKDLAY